MRQHLGRRQLRASLTGILALLLGLGVATTATAQVAGQRRVGDELHFCVNTDSILSGLDRAVAEAIAGSLLLPLVVHDLGSAQNQDVLDYQYLPINDAGLFLILSETCQALVGFRLNVSGAPEWATVTRPFYSTRVVFAQLGGRDGKPVELRAGDVIGARTSGPGGPALSRYLDVMPETSAWRRAALPTNKALVENLVAGKVAGIMIWEPAAYIATGGAPREAGWTLGTLPFETSNVEFAIIMLREDIYLRTELDRAIESLIASGAIAALAARLGLPASVTE